MVANQLLFEFCAIQGVQDKVKSGRITGAHSVLSIMLSRWLAVFADRVPG